MSEPGKMLHDAFYDAFPHHGASTWEDMTHLGRSSWAAVEASIRTDQRQKDAQVIDARVAELRAEYGGYLGQSGAISATVRCASAIRGGKDG